MFRLIPYNHFFYIYLVSGDECPRLTIPSIVGSIDDEIHRSKTQQKSTKISQKVFGKDVFKRRNDLTSYHRLMKDGAVADWDALEDLWNHAFSTIFSPSSTEVELEQEKILITEPPLNPISNRFKIIELLFEKFNFKQVNVSNQAMLALHARGLLSGMVVESGEDVTTIVPVFQGFVYDNCIKRNSVAGRVVTSHLGRSLRASQGLPFHEAWDGVGIETVRQIKESVCFVSSDYTVDQRLARETTVLTERYNLPDGTTVLVGQERFEAPEILFNPNIAGFECRGLSDLVYDTIQEVDMSCRREFYSHIILSGGSTLFPGLAKRLRNDIQARYLKEILNNDESRNNMTINVEAPKNRQFSVFSGASIAGELMKDSPDFWIDRCDYEELGAERAFANISHQI